MVERRNRRKTRRKQKLITKNGADTSKAIQVDTRELLQNKNQLNPIAIEDPILEIIHTKLKFHSKTLFKPKPWHKSSFFIIRTNKPIQWDEFITRVAKALEDLL